MIVVNSGYTYCQRRTGLRLPGSVRIEEEKAMSIGKKSFENVSGETRAKAQNCQSEEELAALAKETGVELSDELLEAVAGGKNWCERWCGKGYCNLHHGCTYTKG